jgi:hypothetical protein
MADPAELLSEHYQKTYELTYELWRQRNRTFLILVGVIGAATLLTFDIPGTQSLLVDFVAKVAGVTGESRVQELRQSFPYGVLQSILLLVVFYLMVNLHHRALYILRNYRYLGALESEIRQQLGLPDGTVAFTRESSFYWGSRGALLGWVKWIYIILLGSLLMAFLLRQIWNDVEAGTTAFLVADAALAIMTLAFFLAYATSSVNLDTESAIVGGSGSQQPELGSGHRRR